MLHVEQMPKERPFFDRVGALVMPWVLLTQCSIEVKWKMDEALLGSGTFGFPPPGPRRGTAQIHISTSTPDSVIEARLLEALSAMIP